MARASLPRTVAIIQARMGSSRLPGKVLMPLAGRPVIEWVIERVRQAQSFDEIVVATTVGVRDDQLARVAADAGALVVRGDELDVLGRYAEAAALSNADAIMRITADCPLIDPGILAAMVSRFQDCSAPCDLVTNARRRTYPRGLDAEIFARSALDVMAAEAAAPHQREHVTPFLYEHPERFAIVDFAGERDLSMLRWTLDTPEDGQLLSRIFEAAADPASLRLGSTLEILDANPSWNEINAHIEQKKY